MGTVRLPIEPLIASYGRSYRDFRSAVKASSSVLNRAKLEGLSVEVADRYAVRCNLHPVEVWGMETWLTALEAK
jgi:hypothetical protein